MNNTPTFGLQQNWIAFKTIVIKEIVRFQHIWTQTLLPPAITMSLYFIIFGKFIGSQLHTIQGYTYIQYIVPGLVMMSIMTNSYANTVASFFFTKFNKSIEEMLVSPMSTFVMLLGFMLGGTIRGLIVGTIVISVGALFTHLPMLHPAIVLVMALLAAMVFSLAGLINGVFAKNFDDIAFVPTFILTPLTYLGGVFYSIHQLPRPFRSISLFNPIFEMVDSFRYGLLGISDINILYGFALVSLLFIVLFFISWALLVKGVGIKV
jgi:ABC-2 type transport system permease protein